MAHRLLAAFARSDSPPMVAAALEILASLAGDPESRREIVGPWAWDLRRRARDLARTEQVGASEQAKVIARVVEAVALGELGPVDLAAGAAAIGASAEETRLARTVLASAMVRPRAAI